MEIWKPIPFAPAYKASSFGNIIGVRGRLLYPTLTDRGYLVCDIHRIQYRVNRIICITFHGEPPTTEHHAAHKDNDRINNYESNLYWASPLENGRDLAASNHIKGTANCVNTLTEADVRFIRKLREEGWSVTDIHIEYFANLSYGTINHVTNNRTWRHV